MATRVTINNNWLDCERAFLRVPEGLVREVRKAISVDLAAAKQQMLGNVSGAVLNTVSGQLRENVGAMTRATRTSVYGRAGSKYFIGRFWEEGFIHRTPKGKEHPQAPRKWAQPVVDHMAHRIAEDIEKAVDAALRKEGF